MLWSVASAGSGLAILTLGVLFYVRARKYLPSGELSPVFTYTLVLITVPVLLLQLGNVVGRPFEPSFGVYLVGVLWSMLVASMLFLRMVVHPIRQSRSRSGEVSWRVTAVRTAGWPRGALAPVSARSVPALRCTLCEGLWFAAGDFARFLKGDARHPVLPPLEVSEDDYTPVRRPHRRRACPACRSASLEKAGSASTGRCAARPASASSSPAPGSERRAGRGRSGSGTGCCPSDRGDGARGKGGGTGDASSGIRWPFWWRWVLATNLGWFPGIFVGVYLASFVGAGPVSAAVVAGVPPALLFGAAQACTLRGALPAPLHGWCHGARLATGHGAGATRHDGLSLRLSPLADAVLVAAIAGSVLGLAQAAVLRGVYPRCPGGSRSPVSGWAALFPGAVPGAGLVWLARQGSRQPGQGALTTRAS